MEFFFDLKHPVKILAPMVGNSGLAYRILARKYGSDLCYTEMVHCKQFLSTKSNGYENAWYVSNIRKNNEDISYEEELINYPKDDPLVVQICGNDPDIMLEAAKKMQNYCNAIDINFGCPQKIAKKGFYGAYLQNDIQLTSKIIKNLCNNLNVPVFCKIRILPDLNETLNYARMIENSGCSLLAVHGRTKEQKGENTGLANWDYIKKIKENLKIPIIANGNVLYKENVNQIIEYTKCDGVMVAETHLHNPLIFYEKNKESICFEILFEYLNLCKKIKTKGSEIKSHIYKILHKILNIEDRIKIEKTHGLENYIVLLKQIEAEKHILREDFTLEGRIRKIPRQDDKCQSFIKNTESKQILQN